MSETANEPLEEKPEKKKGSKLFLILGLLVVLGLGGAAGYYFLLMPSGEAKDEKAEKKKEKNSTSNELILGDTKASEEKSSEAEKSEDSENADDVIKISLPSDENVKHVVELPAFIVNLADTDEPKYLRMTVSLGLGGEAEEKGEPDQLFMTRIKNAMLSVLGTKSSEDVLSVKGKAKLRRELLKAAQAVSGEPPIEAIYITDFIVQL